MLYYLASLLRPEVDTLRVLTYNTVRAGGAAFTAFVFALILGPPLIRALRKLKIGQHIRQEHVEDLHALHKGKQGTPTMGGALIVLSTAFSALLWGQLHNRLLLIALAVFCALGAVGFLDDYIKLRRKENQGLSAKAKFTGQILVGILLGVYLVANPITVSATYLREHDVLNWRGFVQALQDAGQTEVPTAARQFWQGFSPQLQADLENAASLRGVHTGLRERVLAKINQALEEPALYESGLWQVETLNGEAAKFLESGAPDLNQRELVRFNRILLESAFPKTIAHSTRQLHTKIEVPGFRNVLIPLGVFYAVFVVIIIVGASNAVNLTDGLDGLAIGASVMSLLAYTGIAYIVSRVDWSEYLFLIYVPEASELPVLGAAMLGAGLGFLWFNCHPAEVFMGDTGSLALGGAIGTMAILTKQELLLIVIGGLFVVEAASVIIQVASFKLRGKRVFKMAPLHHHFELLGWSESKVTIRFWILSLLFALMGMLGALKLR